MDTLILKIAIVLFGLFIIRFMLSRLLVNTQKKQQFSKEYLDILNNPEYRVKGSYD